MRAASEPMNMDYDLHDIAVLAVDDIEDNLDLIEAYLEDVVWSVLRARSGTEAIRLATEHKPDIVLLDLMMPGMNGLAVLRTIRSIEALHDIAVILQTAYASRDSVLTAHRTGCKHILCKPLTKERLLAELRACLSDGRRRRDRTHPNELPQSPQSNDLSDARDDAQKVIEAGGLDEVIHTPETVDCLRHLIAADSPIGQRLITLANSPIYGGSCRVGTIPAAMIRIGTKETRKLIQKASSAMRGGLSSSRAPEALQLLETIARLFPDRVSAPEDMLALLRELGAAKGSGKHAAADAALSSRQDRQGKRDRRE